MKDFHNNQIMFLIFTFFIVCLYPVKAELNLSYFTEEREKSKVPHAHFSTSYLMDLFSTHLKVEKIFIITEDVVIDSLNIDAVLEKAEALHSSFVISRMENFDTKNYSEYFLKMEELIVVLLISNDKIQEFCEKLSFDVNWVSEKLILIFLNVKQSLGYKISSSVVQKFKYILIVELTTKMDDLLFSLYSLYPFAKKQNWKLFEVNKKKNIEDLFIDRVPNFRGEVLKVTSVWFDFPYLYKKMDDDVELKLGSNIDMLEIIGDKLNFSFVLLDNEEESFGLKLNDTTWIGILGDLAHKGRDIGINSLFLVIEVAEFSYAQPYHIEYYAFLAMIPDPLPDWKKIIMPFTQKLWISFLCTIIIYTVTYFCCLKIYHRSEPENSIPSTSSVIITLLKIPLRQGLEEISKEVWSQTFIGVLLLTMFLLTSAYTSTLISFLTVPRYPKRIETLREIAESDFRIIQTQYESVFFEVVARDPNKDVVAIGERIEPKDFDFMAKHAGDLVRKREAIISEVYSYLTFLQFQLNLAGKSYILKAQMIKSYIVFMFPKSSVLRDPVNKYLMMLVESGIADELYRRHTDFIRKPILYDNDMGPIQLSLKHLQTAFYLLVGGLFLSTALFIGEILYKRLK